MKYTVTENQTLLEALGKFSPKSSKTTLRCWLKEGRVFVDERVQKIATSPVEAGQVITLGVKEKVYEGGLKILYEDSDLVVIEKPAGLLSVSTAFQKTDTAHSILKKKYRPTKVYVVHRLDQETSGVMLFALSEEAFLGLKDLFADHTIERAYCAVVEGNMEESSGTFSSYLLEDKNYVVHEVNSSKGQLAITHYEVEASNKRYSWLNLRLETGRKNQIRVHCQSAGHSIAGDKKYGAKTSPIKRLCLHAYYLAFEHPITHKKMEFESPIPKEFYKILEQ
jgi:23S rRNA pseudouridine1911/1915/1917 synthase